MEPHPVMHAPYKSKPKRNGLLTKLNPIVQSLSFFLRRMEKYNSAKEKVFHIVLVRYRKSLFCPIYLFVVYFLFQS